MAGESPLRVLLVDDEPKLVFALEALLQSAGGFAVVGSAHNGRDGVEKALQLRPDVIVLDVRMPGFDGIAAAAAICASWHEARIVVYSGDDEELDRARAAGISTTLPKDGLVHALPPTLRSAAGLPAPPG